MKIFFCAATVLLLGLIAGRPANAHFVFVVPAESGVLAAVVFSESLERDENVDDTPLVGMSLQALVGDGEPQLLKVVDVGEGCAVDVPKATRQLCGRLDYGVMSRDDGNPFLLVYHPKTVIGDPFLKNADDEATGVQLSLEGQAGEARFVLRNDGAPVPAADVRLVLPDGSEEELQTDETGATSAVATRGRLAAWARYVETKTGNHAGQVYSEIRHYPSLVVDVPTVAAANEAAVTPSTQLPPLPEAASSLGAVACNGYVYVYGGHISPVHTYSTQAVSGRFHRMSLADPSRWEELPAGVSVQGMNLATHAGKVYCVGGMQPRNMPSADADNHSVVSASCFDPADGRWHPLPDLPEARSSHDIAVIGDTLYVVGGWGMHGEAGGEMWADTMFALDLAKEPTAEEAAWERLPQPFVRRALIVAAADGKLFVLGGFTDSEEVSQQVDVFDPVSGEWSRGPDLPEGSLNGFAPAACTVDGAVFVSVADGSIHRLPKGAAAWEPVARARPRIAHRMVSCGSDAVMLLGGAHRRDNLDLVEVVSLQLSRE